MMPINNYAISRSAAIDIINEERRFIESLRETAFDNEDRAHNTGELVCAIRLARKIKDLPALDVAQVVHARWGEAEVVGYDGIRVIYGFPCKRCGRHVRHIGCSWCPWCGAKMDATSNVTDKNDGKIGGVINAVD